MTQYVKKTTDIKVEAPFISEEYVLDTNYYHCNVRLICFTYDYLVPLLDLENLQEILTSHGVASVEGLIFVSNLKANKREGVEQYLKYNKEIVEKFNPEFMMCIANMEANPNQDLFEIFKFGENEIFIEVIDDDLENIEPTKPDPNVQKPKFEEKYGIDRVIENFECHMWPNMNKKDSKKKPTHQSEGENSTKEKQETLKEAKEENKVVEITTEKIAKDDKTEEQSHKVDDDLKKDDRASKKVQEDTNQKKDLDTNINPFEYEDEDEKDMDNLAHILETVRQFKNNSKDLSDDQRKQRAADLIMQLVANCKDLQDDDDDDNDSDN